jgi:DNA replication protein DnaC
MLNQPIHQALTGLGLRGMARAYDQHEQSADLRALTFADRLALMLDVEQMERANARMAQRLRWARLGQSACLEDLDLRAPRGIDRTLLAKLGTLGFLDERLNLLVTGPTGVGKSYLACAIGQRACRENRSVRYLRMPRLVDELVKAGAMHKKGAFYKQLARVELIILDDFGLAPLADETKRDLLEILDDRFDRKSTVIVSQHPVEHWHTILDEPALADAILDRVVHNAHRIELQGESMRRKKPAT